MGDVKRYATVVIKRLDDSWALADWVPDDAFIALEIKYDALEKDYRDKLGQLLGTQRDNDALRARLAEVERERDRLRRVVHRFESHLLDGDGHLKAHWGCANNRNEPCNCPDFNRHPEPTPEPTE